MLAEPRSSVIVAGKRQITSKYTDGAEVYEEYDVVTDDLLLRKRRQKNSFGAMSDWVVEIGTDVKSHTKNLHQNLIVESSGSPELVRQDTKEAHVFRIRNLPYPKEVFSVTIEKSSPSTSSASKDSDAANATGEKKIEVGEIVVRTSNKRYFKRIDIPDMVRANIPLDASHLSFDVKHNTLIITYKKHLAILTAEAAARKERLSMPATRKEEDAGCPTQ